MTLEESPFMKSRIEEPTPSPPDSERHKKRKRSTDTENPEPRPPRDRPSPEVPHNPQDIPEQEVHAE